MRRRDFLAAGLTAGGGLLCPRIAGAGAGTIHARAPEPLRILFLGGTTFVGPAIVDLAIDRGHEVTLFNRGLTNPGLYTHLERLTGDRDPERGRGLTAIEGRRRWDVVIDTWQGSPLAVDRTAKLLSERACAYVYISSVAVYQGVNFRRKSFDESAELPKATMPASFDTDLSYPVRKQLGERAVRGFAGDPVILRAYGIQGTDPRGRLDTGGFPYWPLRLHRGGTVLAPGDGKDFTQWTDLRDLADFTLHAIETRRHGTFNVARGALFADFLGALAELSPRRVDLRWVPAEFLFERGIESFTDVPLWVWRKEREGGFFRGRTTRAEAAGLRPRTIQQSFRPMIDAYLLHHADHDLMAGPAIARREAELLGEWDRRL